MLKTMLIIAATTGGTVLGMVRSAGAPTALEAAVDHQRWDDPGVRDRLDASSIDELRDLIGDPEIRTRYAEAPGWQPGLGRPALADDDAAIQQVQSYCLANRARRRMSSRISALLPIDGGAIHPSECGWCQYPDAELAAAVGWAVMVSRYIVDEYAIWPAATGHQPYVRRTDRIDTYESPRHKTFFGIPGKDRAYLIEQAARAAGAAA